MAKLLGLDVGVKRVGYALGDTDLAMVFPRDFFVRSNDTTVFEAILNLCVAEKIQTIVVGVPLGEENEETLRSTEIRSFCQNLAAYLATKGLEIPMTFEDESFSSKEAQGRIPLKRDRKKKGRDDSIAAAIILERYIDTAKNHLVAEGGFEPPTSRL